jgi:hypothetical protein
MLYREIIAVCSQIHTKHINTLCGQNVELLDVKLAVHKLSLRLWKANIQLALLHYTAVTNICCIRTHCYTAISSSSTPWYILHVVTVRKSACSLHKGSIFVPRFTTTPLVSGNTPLQHTLLQRSNTCCNARQVYWSSATGTRTVRTVQPRCRRVSFAFHPHGTIFHLRVCGAIKRGASETSSFPRGCLWRDKKTRVWSEPLPTCVFVAR